MEKTTAIPSALSLRQLRGGKPLWIGILAILLLAAASFLVYRLWRGQPAPPILSDSTPISAEQLAEEHGLSIRLIGVTASGGMIDFRLKVLDADKAERFLSEPDHLPRLIAVEQGEALMPAEGLDDDIQWVEGGILFNFYPNNHGWIQPGTPVIVQFGEIYLEPIAAQ